MRRAGNEDEEDVMAMANGTIDAEQVGQIEERWGVEMRDLACELLGGDPFQAGEVVEGVLRGLRGRRARGHRTSQRGMPAWLAEVVVRACLLLTGNAEVADWGVYKARHPLKKETRAAKAARENRATGATGEARVTGVAAQATRKARATLRVVREEAGATEGSVAVEGAPVRPETL